MGLSPSWEAASSRTIQEFSNVLWNPKARYRVHKSPPTVPVLSQLNPIYNTNSYLSKIHLLSTSDICLGLPSSLSPSGLYIKILYSFVLHTMRATCYAHLIFLDLIILTMYIWWITEVMKLLIMQFYPSSCHFISLWSKHSLQHPVLKSLSVYTRPFMSET
jgi:hypothetical protein